MGEARAARRLHRRAICVLTGALAGLAGAAGALDIRSHVGVSGMDAIWGMKALAGAPGAVEIRAHGAFSGTPAGTGGPRFVGMNAVASEAVIHPHRAFYEMRLVDSGPLSGMRGLTGAAVMEWSVGCDVEAFRRETRMLISRADGRDSRVQVDFSAWERLDGTEYGFTGSVARPGAEIERRSGKARLEGYGGGGEARYEQPVERRLALPEGTLFPGAWMRQSIDHARTGEGVLARRVFFGEDDNDPMTVSMVLLPETGVEMAEVPEALAGERRWRAQLAFFDRESGSVPAFESAEWFFENGVGGDALIAFPEFTVGYRLKGVELLDRPDC